MEAKFNLQLILIALCKCQIFFEGSFYCQNEKLNTTTAKFEQVFETSAAFESAFWKCNSKKLTNTDINNLLLIKQQHRRSKYLTFINKIDSFLRYNIFFLLFFYKLWMDVKIESLLMTLMTSTYFESINLTFKRHSSDYAKAKP